MYTRDIERLARTFNNQRMDYEYIKHYLRENYQLDDKTLEEVLEKAGVKPKGKKKGTHSMPSMDDGSGGKPSGGGSKQGFF
jgi:hypothetical protein